MTFLALPGALHLVVHELADVVDPYDVHVAFAGDGDRCLLETPSAPTADERFSWSCSDPLWSMTVRADRITAGPPGATTATTGDPFAALSGALAHCAHALAGAEPDPDVPPLRCALVGWIGYELAAAAEDVIPVRPPDENDAPDAALSLFGTVVATDRLTRRSWLLAVGAGADEADARRDAEARATRTLQRLPVKPQEPVVAPPADGVLDLGTLVDAGWRWRTNPVLYRQAVVDCLDRIAAGDVYEVCLTQRFDHAPVVEPDRLYRMLRAVNPSPRAAHLSFGGFDVLSSSPEGFLRVDADRRVTTRPIKGTRPRRADAHADAASVVSLAVDPKDRAENLMIVDLARNDLGRVCVYGTVRVPQLQAVESHPFTHQMVSTVTGVLRPDVDVADLLRATFPPGSMTGAPKIAAMQILAELEPVRRGIYSGAIGWFDVTGPCDLAVVIRTLVTDGNTLVMQVGGAVVADSDPDAEYQETLDKAHAMLKAVALAELA